MADGGDVIEELKADHRELADHTAAERTSVARSASS